MTEITGGCACGKVRFSLSQPAFGVGVCHCTDCQKSSGGAPNYVALFPKAAFTVTKGEARIYTCQGDSGADIGRAFCADCGSPLWSLPGGDAPFFPVKLGALDDPAAYQPTLHLYTDSAQPWHLMHDDLPRFPKMPPQA